MKSVSRGALPTGPSPTPLPVKTDNEVPLWQQQIPLDPRTFPHGERRSGQLPCTTGNMDHKLTSYRISVSYDVIAKRIVIDLPGWDGTIENADNVKMAIIVGLAEVNNMQRGGIEEQVLALADQNPVNPAAEWINKAPWDGCDRLVEFSATLATREGFPIDLKDVLIKKWMISIVAAVFLPKHFRARGVLTLQGGQGIGKTAWVAALVPDPDVRDRIVKLDHHLDPHDKHSVLTAISHLIVEIGELDSSFRKDVARLKGFMTRDFDKIRRPYARAASEYPRRTVFAATVNDSNFLIDDTGNSRFWTLPLVAINYNHGINMQQVFAQLKVELEAGAEWWLTKEEEAQLAASNLDHRAISPIREAIIDQFNLDRTEPITEQLMGTNDVLRKIGIDLPRNGQNKEVAAILRELIGEPKKHGGYMKWRMPLKKQGFSSDASRIRLT